MRSHTPAYAGRVEPLQSLLAAVIADFGAKKRATPKVALTPIWTATHQKCFDDMQKQLENLTTVAHPDPEKIMCVFTDASDKRYGGMVTQIPIAALELPVDKQRHQE
jgi:RNase H-like domain found in reverse transcriptase